MVVLWSVGNSEVRAGGEDGIVGHISYENYS